MLTIVDYGVGNLNSIGNMLKKAGVKSLISGDAAALRDAEKILLPGMGHFDNCMIRLHASGLMPILLDKVFTQRVPVLGICVGLQMFMRSSEEGVEKGLDWIPGRTIRFREQDMSAGLKVPHMGWADVQAAKESPLVEGLEGARFYFAHSFHVMPDDAADLLMTAEYGYRIPVALQRGNIFGVQFHPEKSHRFGMQLLRNFATKC